MKLKELIREMDYGVSYGSGALKALQNDSMPELDLLVREAIQNSSDAAIEEKYPSFAVSFNVGDFQPSKLNNLLNSIKDILNERYPGDDAKYLEIRDTKTSGLTGPVRLTDLDPDDHGNYFKLVFDTGKEQTASSAGEAGGSWGYGKSVYYRVGIGLVVFYSRIKNNNAYEERLVIGLIEHETDDASLLKRVVDDSVGRAWWGKDDPDDPRALLPLTDIDEIQEVLDIFGLSRFKEKETGTSIIVPYIDTEKLLSGIFPDDCGIPDDEQSMCAWKDSIKDYLELAVQKWYAPKIFNKNLLNIDGQKWLAVKINSDPIRDSDMRPFFQLVQELYTCALYKCNDIEYTSDKFKGIECVAVPSQRITGHKSGYVAYTRIKQNQLSPGGNMIKPYTYLRLFSKSPVNDPIVMFARTPGMVLDYKIDGRWAKGMIRPDDDDEYIVAFYVPDCSAALKMDTALGEFAGTPYGEYLRRCEKSDHMDWDDKSNLSIIGNVKGQVVNKVNAGLKDDQETSIEGTASKLAGSLGRRLLPKLSYGKPQSTGGGTGGSGGGTNSNNLEISLTPFIKNDGIDISFEITFKNNRRDVALGVFVEAETGVIDADTWEKELGGTYPITIDSIANSITISVDTNRQERFAENCSVHNPKVENDYSCMELLFSKSGDSISGFKIHNDITNAIISGVIKLKSSNKKYVCTIKEIKL